MKRQLIIFSILASFLTALSGCEVIGGIFKAGMGVGIFVVIFVIAIIIFIISRIGKNKN